MRVKQCDRCRQLITGQPEPLDYTIGDGNLWGVYLTVNEINGKGPRQADLHTACMLDVLAGYVKAIGPTAGETDQ